MFQTAARFIEQLTFFESFAKEKPPAPGPPPANGSPSTDAELTRMAAGLLRRLGCEATAAQVRVCWTARLTSSAGMARPAKALVLLNPRLAQFPGETERTLLHEVAHLAAFSEAAGKRIAAHGPEWRRACAALGIEDETRCHRLPLPRRQLVRGHTYQCPCCRIVLRRVRPISKRRPLACRRCCQQYAGGRFEAKFQFVRPAQPGP